MNIELTVISNLLEAIGVRQYNEWQYKLALKDKSGKFKAKLIRYKDKHKPKEEEITDALREKLQEARKVSLERLMRNGQRQERHNHKNRR